MNKNFIISKLHSNILKLKQYGVSRIGLFGSYLESQSMKKNDIDILVHFEKGKKTFDNYMDLKFFLEEIFAGNKVDLVIEEALKPALRQHVLETVEYAT